MTAVITPLRRESTALALPGILSETGYALPDGLDFNEWEEIGKKLQRVEKSVRWWIGDWLRYGERTYGEMYAQAIETTGETYQYLADSTYVASAVEFSRRRENLSWSHHREIAALEPTAQTAWLDKAEEEQLSTRDLREQIKNKQQNVAPSIPTCKRCGDPCRTCKALASN